MTKIDIISGFLGAGKTTLIKKLIEEGFENEKLVLIENEFGEIGIDGGFLKDSGVQINEMNQGCICCSLVGDFGVALKQVIDDYTPDRIIIEPSGVGKLSDVIKAVENVDAGTEVVLNSATAVVDVSKAKMYMKNFGEFFNNQIEAAGAIILSRTQNVKEDKLYTAVELIKEHNANASIITTPWDDIDGKIILQAMEHSKLPETLLNLEEEVSNHHHHHDHDEHDENCTCGCHDHDHEHHHHDHDEHDHEHHHHDHDEHDENCTCGCHDHGHEHHHHDHDEHDHEHHHHDHDEHDENCTCGCHDHDHEHHHHDHDEHDHEHHHHDHDEHDENCTCGCHDHDHEHHHHDHDEHDENCTCGCHDHDHHHHHHADEVFTSWGVETAIKYSTEEMEEILKKLSKEEDNEYGIILRSKGIVPNKNGEWIYFDLVPGEYELRKGSPDYTGKLCVIGSKLDESKLKELFGIK